eukprot:CAMPEP_0119395646 /NCGR_PEP_ID=MMETSP1334-20130426/134134_1 /TAXON_ID=127549 /ORGANISM="Calcidiscus leptoporus, Strain RCC1130" /LENGTH=148 /DNA_ID=CAMNT_0007419171 /DNA_START=38 /DNA_END=480 /DNA_ORIENTATION=+
MASETCASMAHVGLGLVGCSWFALRAHVPALLSLEAQSAVRLVAVCSRTRKSMAKAEAAAGRSLTRHAKMEALFADAAVHVVLLALPIPLVADAIEAALRAGKHVFSEKPVCASLARTLTLFRAYSCIGRELGTRPRWLVCENWAYKP